MNHRISVHIKDDPILNASRVFKITSSLVKHDIVKECIVYGKWSIGLKENELWDEDRRIIRVKTSLEVKRAKGQLINPTFFRKVIALFSIFQFHIAILTRLFYIRNVQYVCVHNPEFLVLASIYKIFNKVEVIYLPHELEPHKTGLSTIGRFFIGLLETIFIKVASSVVLVCDPIKEWYDNKYHLKRTYVVKNIPNVNLKSGDVVKSRILRDEFGIPDDHIIFIYQGGIEKSRGCDQILDVFKEVKKDRHIIMMGFGSLESEVIALSEKYSNIHFRKAVPMQEITKYTSSADIGLFFLFDEPSLSYKLSLPNKFSEYMISGIPILVSGYLFHLTQLVKEFNLGWSILPSKSGLQNFINSVSLDNISNLHQNIINYKCNVSWEKEEKQILKAFSVKY